MRILDLCASVPPHVYTFVSRGHISRLIKQNPLTGCADHFSWVIEIEIVIKNTTHKYGET